MPRPRCPNSPSATAHICCSPCPKPLHIQVNSKACGGSIQVKLFNSLHSSGGPLHLQLVVCAPQSLIKALPPGPPPHFPNTCIFCLQRHLLRQLPLALQPCLSELGSPAAVPKPVPPARRQQHSFCLVGWFLLLLGFFWSGVGGEVGKGVGEQESENKERKDRGWREYSWPFCIPVWGAAPSHLTQSEHLLASPAE